MRFPHRIPQLLKQARQVRKKAKTRLARGGRTTFSGRVKPPKPENQTGRTSRRATSTSKTAPTAKDLREATDEGEPASVQSLAEAASHPEPQDEQGQEPMEPTRLPLVGETAYYYVQPVLPDFEADVDWGGRTARQAQTVAPQPVQWRGRCHAPRWGRCSQEFPATNREDRPRWGRKDHEHLAAAHNGSQFDLYRTSGGGKSNKFRHTWLDGGMHRTLGLQAVSVTGEFDFLSLAKPSLIGRAAEPETPQRGSH